MRTEQTGAEEMLETGLSRLMQRARSMPIWGAACWTVYFTELLRILIDIAGCM